MNQKESTQSVSPPQVDIIDEAWRQARNPHPTHSSAWLKNDFNQTATTIYQDVPMPLSHLEDWFRLQPIELMGPQSSTSNPILESAITPTISYNTSFASAPLINQPSASICEETTHQLNSRSGTRTRRPFQWNEVKAMVDLYKIRPYPTREEFEDLSAQLQIPIQRMRIWFNNKRAKEKLRKRVDNRNLPNKVSLHRSVGYRIR